MNGYQPFPISEFKTGIFSYLDPWQRPADAFDPLLNAYVYRGILQKREGYRLLADSDFPWTSRIAYKDFLQFGDGTAGPFTGIILTNPIVPGSLTITDGTEIFTSNTTTPVGTLTGDLGGSGTITWASGSYSVTFNASVSSTTPIFATFSLDADRPIMALKTWIDPANDDVELIACDTRRASVFNDATRSFEPLNTIVQTLWVGDGTSTSKSFSAGFAAVAPYTQSLVPTSISITDGTSTIVDDGAGNLSAAGNFTGGTVNYATGAITITMTAGTTATITLSATLQGNYFTGDFTNFFNATNWNAPGDEVNRNDCIYLTNNIDRITLYNGSNLSRPNFYTLDADRISGTNDIQTTLDIKVFKNRLLLLRPHIVGDANPEAPSIRFSAILNSNNLVADVVGNGGLEEAPTSDWIYSAEFIRDQLVVFFTNSTRLFRFTGSNLQPFRFDTLNTSKSTRAEYSSVDYDERCTSIGNKGLIACDGVNVQRFDIGIIDQFLQIDQNFIGQCFSERFDTLNQTWTLFPDLDNTEGQSNKVLVYNFLENTWSIYDLPLSCLGIYNTYQDLTWSDLDDDLTWEEADFRWNEFFVQDLSPVLIGGGHDGNVYQMNFGDTDNFQSYDCDITTTAWNPFAKEGKSAIFGYLDIYYDCSSDCTILAEIFPNGSSIGTDPISIPLEQSEIASPTQDSNWQRLYINLSAQFIKIKFTSDSQANFKIKGMILYAKPSGRLSFGKTIL